MSEQKIKNKIVLLGLAALLFVSCGGSGGGGGESSNAPTNPASNVSPIGKKVENIVNPDNSGNANNTTDNMLNKENGNSSVKPSNSTQNEPRESLETLRARMSEAEVKEHILKEQKNSAESIPTDNEVRDSSKVKVGVLDGDFISGRVYLKNKYDNIEILDRNTNPRANDHGDLVLRALRDGNQLGVIAGSIGQTDGNGVIPNVAVYKTLLSKFDPNQKVKVISQSWGVPESMATYNKRSSDEKKAIFSSNKEEGEKILNFYNEQVDKDTLFVWANGNTESSDAYLQAALPSINSDLEKGWIAVVGVQKKAGNKLNVHYDGHFAWAGTASWWAISADAEVFDKDGVSRKGSSFAAPKVARAAALVAQKYDWMTADQVRQTLFTTTDRTEIDINEPSIRNTSPIPDWEGKYGWGMLNQERALKGPGAFINIRKQYKDSQNSNNIFRADIPEGKVSYFENDIIGDGGLEKSGKGTLHLTGNNSYERGSIVKDGTLEIHKVHANKVDIENDGTLVLHSKAIIGYNTNAYNIINDSEITADKIIARNVDNKGTLKVKGTTAIIGGDYIARPGSTTEMNISSKVRVLGNVNMQGAAVLLSADRYVAMGEQAVLLEGANAEGSVANAQIDGMRKANVEVKDGKVVATLLRENPVEYLGENAEESSRNVAENVENVFQDLDRKVFSGTATDKELTMVATLQGMSPTSFSSATELMSGEIYASAQALTFSQSQNINRDLSNRLSGLDNLKNSNKDSEVWFSAIGSGGKLKRDGYASADTRVTGGQFGMDTKFGSTTTLGMAMNYSYAKANFNRYAGKSTSDMVGVSLYGKQDLPYGFYATGRLGLANISSKVERELLTLTGDTVTGKIKHHDRMLSSYLELGKKFEWFTPFVGYSQDYLRRGSFNESEAAWGIKADKKNYTTSNFLVGARAEYLADKYRIQAYVTQAINTDKRDLSYEGKFTGANVNQKFYGVKQAKNTTWIGVGAFREINPAFGVYGNVDFRVEDKKWADSVISTGLQYKF